LLRKKISFEIRSLLAEILSRENDKKTPATKIFGTQKKSALKFVHYLQRYYHEKTRKKRRRQKYLEAMKRDRESEISSREDDKNVESKEMNDEEQKELGHKLYYAAYDGEYEVVKKLLQNVKKLLQNMVDVKAFMNKSRALLGAAYSGHIEIVKLLIQNDYDVNARGVFNRTALHEAAEYGHVDIAKVLIQNGADVHALDDQWKRNAIHYVQHGDIALMLIQNGVDVNLLNYDRTPLHIAADRWTSDVTVVKVLLQNGADMKKDTFEWYVVFERGVRARSARISLFSSTYSEDSLVSPTQHSTVSLTRKNINRAFALFLGYGIDRHDSLSSFTYAEDSLVSPTQHSTVSLTRNNINRAFALFLGYGIDRHDSLSSFTYSEDSLVSPTQHSTVSLTRNNINRAFALFLCYGIDRHGEAEGTK